MDHANLIAIDVHTHAEVSCWNPFDNYGEEYDRAPTSTSAQPPPTIAETIAYYRERKIGLVMFTVDSESKLGPPPHPERGDRAGRAENSDMMMCFASIDPHKGKMGAREAERLIKEHGVQGLQVPPDRAGLPPLRQDGLADLRGDQRAQDADDLPHRPQRHRLGHALRRRAAAGVQQPDAPGRRGDLVPDMQIVMAHPSFPWQDEALSVATHKPNVWIDLVGLEPEVLSRSSWCSTPTRC
jgi:predicted TIM-barrel fold metal-dependent hydrolase